MITLAIARQTVREAMRRRVMWIFLIIGVFLIALGPVFGFLSPKESTTVLKSLGFAAILLAGLFITIVTCIYLIPVEIERRTIYTVLSKPVQRYEFVLGKFLGGFTTVFINIAAMGIVFMAMMALQNDKSGDTSFILLRILHPHWWAVQVFHNNEIHDIARGILLTFFQLLLLAALSIFFSTFATPVVNFFLSFGIFLVGNLSVVTDTLTSSKFAPARYAGLVVHYLIPNFGNFNLQNSLIHPETVVGNTNVLITRNIAYALIYSAVLLILAILIFDRREV